MNGTCYDTVIFDDLDLTNTRIDIGYGTITSNTVYMIHGRSWVNGGTYTVTHVDVPVVVEKRTPSKTQQILERQYALAQRSHNKKQMKLLEKQMNAIKP